MTPRPFKFHGYDLLIVPEVGDPHSRCDMCLADSEEAWGDNNLDHLCKLDDENNCNAKGMPGHIFIRNTPEALAEYIVERIA